MAPPPVPDRTETLAPRASSPAIDDGPPSGRDPAPARELELDSDDPERYEQVAEHGRGGLGRVVRAIDKRLGRTVAVKELLRRGSASTPAHEARFLREALITARLEHPGIVPVHEAGRWPNGDPYYVMKLVEGRTLKELISERRTLRERVGLVPHVIAIADAVGYAHSEGVIHRDLKPSNVIVGAFGETIVVDWGLARDRKRDVPEPTDELILGSGSGVSTVTGKVVGTPAYMSPEQARGELVDERADVYAIGAVLYELLAGVPPHHDATPQATLDRVIAGPPRPIAAAVAHVPSELATIVSKAMARCPEDRYPNATSLAEDLRRFQTGKLVSAHSYTAWSLLRKKLAQHRGVVAVAVASAVALGAIGVESFRRVVVERNIAQSERSRAVDAQAQAEKRQRELVLLQAVTSLRDDPTATLAWLKDYAISDEDRSSILEVVDEAIAAGVARHVFRPGDWVFDAVFTPDGTTLVAAVRDGSLRAYDLRTGSEARLGTAESAPELLVMSPDGRFAITSGSLGQITMWPLHGGESRVIARNGRMASSIRLAADGTRLLVLRETGAPEEVPLDGSPPRLLGPKTTLRSAVAGADWTRAVITTTRNQVMALDGDTLRPLARTDKGIVKLAMSPRGDVVLVHDGATIWRVPYAGGKLEKLLEYDGKVRELEWSPDERSLVVGGDLHDIKLVDLVTGQVRELRGHTDAIYTLEWTRDGRRVLSAGDDGTARVWTVFDATSIVLRGHDDDVYRARFSNDEHQVVTSSLDGTARVWPIDQPGARTLVEGDAIENMWVDGGRALVKTSTEVAWWNLASGHRVPVFSWAKELRGLGLGMTSPDGERLVVPAADSSLEVRHRSGPTVVLRGHANVISGAQFSRDNQQLFTSSFDGTLRRWDLTTGEGTILIEGSIPLRGFALGARNQVVVQVGDAAKQIEPDGTVVTLGEGPAWCIAYAEFDKVRDRLLVRRCDLSLALFDGTQLAHQARAPGLQLAHQARASGLHPVELPTGNYHVSRLAVSADGNRIAGAMGDRTVRVWDAASGRVDILRGHSDLPLDVAFSPDGSLLASSSYDKTIRIWQLGTHRHRVLRGHTGAVDRVAWRDPSSIVTGGRDGTIRIWDLPSMMLPTAAELGHRIHEATSARIDIDRPTSRSPTRRGT
ncbi:MAG: protein kinase [Myxococcota bacterium]|nr:protein kinase [Myxococcota bacterium]